MGPRHCCRGISPRYRQLHGCRISFNGATALLPWNHVAEADLVLKPDASMGPRHCCRGIVVGGRWASMPLYTLQWGHGIAAVESGDRVLSELKTVLASMGPRHCCRGIISLTIPFVRAMMRFNGATALLPWNQPHLPPSSRAKTRFNGATALLPWNPPAAMEWMGSAQGFNGATALLPWNRDLGGLVLALVK